MQAPQGRPDWLFGCVLGNHRPVSHMLSGTCGSVQAAVRHCRSCIFVHRTECIQRLARQAFEVQPRPSSRSPLLPLPRCAMSSWGASSSAWQSGSEAASSAAAWMGESWADATERDVEWGQWSSSDWGAERGTASGAPSEWKEHSAWKEQSE